MADSSSDALSAASSPKPKTGSEYYRAMTPEQWVPKLVGVIRALEGLQKDLNFALPQDVLIAEMRRLHEDHIRMMRSFGALRAKHTRLETRYRKAVVNVRKLMAWMQYGKVLLARPKDLAAYKVQLDRVKLAERVNRHRAKKKLEGMKRPEPNSGSLPSLQES